MWQLCHSSTRFSISALLNTTSAMLWECGPFRTIEHTSWNELWTCMDFNPMQMMDSIQDKLIMSIWKLNALFGSKLWKFESIFAPCNIRCPLGFEQISPNQIFKNQWLNRVSSSKFEAFYWSLFLCVHKSGIQKKKRWKKEMICGHSANPRVQFQNSRDLSSEEWK